jgi:hypothetical protein
VPINLSQNLNQSFLQFSNIVKKIKAQQINKKELDQYLNELNTNIETVSGLIESTPTVLMDKTKF